MQNMLFKSEFDCSITDYTMNEIERQRRERCIPCEKGDAAGRFDTDADTGAGTGETGRGIFCVGTGGKLPGYLQYAASYQELSQRLPEPGYHPLEQRSLGYRDRV